MKASQQSLEKSLYQSYLNSQGETNREQRAKLKRLLSNALQYHLTPLERRELVLYYSGQANIPQIARMTGTAPSTVCRNIQRGKRKLDQVLRCWVAE